MTKKPLSSGKREILTLRAKQWMSEGHLEREQASYVQAMNCYQKALQTFERLEDALGIAQAKGQMGNVFKQTSRYAEALEVFQSALQITKKNELHRQRGVTLANMSTLYSFLATGPIYGNGLTTFKRSTKPSRFVSISSTTS